MSHLARSSRARTARLVCALAALAAAFPAGLAGALPASAVPRPVALAADDFDADGVPDLACGYASGGGGFVTIARGDGAAISRPAGASRDATPPFFEPRRAAAIPVAPDLLAAGDFDDDGRRDLVAGALGGDALYVLSGDGRGALGAPRALALPGKLTALACGDVDRIDGLADLVAAVDGAAGPRLLVFEGPDGAARATPEAIGAPAPVTAIAIGRVDDDARVDVAAAAGSDVLVVRGRDRGLFAGEAGAHAAPPVVEVRATSAPVRTSDLEALARRPRPSAVSLAKRDVLASLRMRLNGDAVDDVVTIEAGGSAPSFVLSEPAATFTVTTTDDAGPGSLRAAIEAANASPGEDLIAFAIPGSGVRTIRPLTPLPDVTEAASVDGATQPGYAGAPLVELDGSLAGEGTIGLHIVAGSSLVRGLVVNGFRLGEDGADNSGIGVFLEGGTGSVVEGNSLGVDATGTVDRANEGWDVFLYDAAGTTIGGTTAAARNVIAGSCQRSCVMITFSANATDNRVEGNYIGTDRTGTVDLNDRSVGVLIDGSVDNVVGGTAPGAGNVISGNGGDFVGGNVYLQATSGNLVQGNLLGTDPTGTTPVGTSLSDSLIMDGAATDNTIGGTAAGAGNLIAFGLSGVQVGEYNGISDGNAILGNAIFGHDDNIGLGLGYDNVTPNDPGDVDAGPNGFQNFPVLTSASATEEAVMVTGRLNSRPSASYRIEFFANTECSVFGFGEGETLVGAQNVTTDATGNVDFTAGFPAAVAAGQSITATATDADGNTSEFSMCVELSLSWRPPDPDATTPFAPPRDLTALLISTGGQGPIGSVAPAFVARPRTDPVSEYRVYRSGQPGVQPSDATFYTSVPATQTAADASVFAGGSFFVVTAVYPTGESGPSNEVETGTPPVLTTIKASSAKVVAKGSGFTTDAVLVTADGIPFQTPAVVKGGGTKLTQRGALITGESLGAYARAHNGVVTILFRNSNGGVDGRRVPVKR